MKLKTLAIAIAASSLSLTAQADLKIGGDIGVGYFINDTWMVGAKSTNDEIFVENGDNKEGNFKLLARYYYSENIYITADVPTEEFADNLRLGAGYSFAAYGSFHIEPNYTFNVTEQDGERNGRLNLGLSYKF